eukprot:snap_masked-scaffold_7-processed-gene-19.66-mRNA-1 protein AED:1.00 eAED:1.00 QI:0/0/0/0/1/1/2/0/233
MHLLKKFPAKEQSRKLLVQRCENSILLTNVPNKNTKYKLQRQSTRFTAGFGYGFFSNSWEKYEPGSKAKRVPCILRPINYLLMVFIFLLSTLVLCPVVVIVLYWAQTFSGDIYSQVNFLRQHILISDSRLFILWTEEKPWTWEKFVFSPSGWLLYKLGFADFLFYGIDNGLPEKFVCLNLHEVANKSKFRQCGLFTNQKCYYRRIERHNLFLSEDEYNLLMNTYRKNIQEDQV